LTLSRRSRASFELKTLPLIVALLLPSVGNSISILEADSIPSLKLEHRGDGRNELTATITNQGSQSVSIEFPIGIVAVGKSGSRMATIRPMSIAIEKTQTAEIIIPAVPLSLKNGTTPESLTLTRDKIDALKPLFDWSENQNDLPRKTAQLVALLLLENASLPQLQAFLAREPISETRPTPADIAGIVDALSIVRQIAPDRKLVIADDPEFRLRALRNPWSRPKAMQLFGMNPPEGVPIPDLNQLLHTKPGDNCPVCRLRSPGADPSNGL
jgi:hypothetical protein